MSETASAARRDFFSGMVERALGHAPALAPRLPMPFEPLAQPGPADEALVDAPISSFARPTGAGDVSLPPPVKPTETQTRIEVIRERTIIAPAPAPSPLSNDRPALTAVSAHIHIPPHEERAPELPPDSQPRHDLLPPNILTETPRSLWPEAANESSMLASAATTVVTPQSFDSIHVGRHEQLLTTETKSAQRQDQIQPAAPHIPIQPDKQAAAATNALTPKTVHIEPPLARPVLPRDLFRIPPAAAASAEPPVNVTIGVVEVRMEEKAAAPQSRTDRSRRTPMSLEDYLQRRRG